MKGIIGWRITKEGDYKINLPILSQEEEQLILELEHYFREVTRFKDFSSKEELVNELKNALVNACDEHGYLLTEKQLAYLSYFAYLHIYGLGFFEEMLKNDEIEEITVIGINKPVYVYLTKEGWKKANVEITSIDYLIDIINKMASALGRRITFQNPRLDTTLKDGSRLHASLPPISQGEITIRKFKQKPLSVKEIVEMKTLPSLAVAIFSFFIQGDFSLMMCGNTASGKTTLLNSIFSFFPSSERILIIEETPEINLLHNHIIRLVANKEMEITLKDLVYDALRMRPDRVVVGEIRNAEEGRALFDVLLSGQARGVYATFHAKSVNEAISRILSFGISKTELNAIDVFSIQKRMLIYNKSKKSVEERRRLYELAIYDNKPIEIIKYKILSDDWEIKNMDKLCNFISERIGMKSEEIKEEIKRREKLIEKAPNDYKEFFYFVQENIYGIG